MATILIVDDERANRELLATVLSRSGHTMLECANGAAGLEMAKNQRPDLVIMDLHMPGMGGAEFVKELRSDPALADVKIALYTATATDAAMRQFMELARIGHVIPKPSEPDQILRAVSAALE